MSVYPERRNGRLTGKWIAEVTHLGVRVRKRFDTMREAQRWEDGVKATGAPPQHDRGKPAVFAANPPTQTLRTSPWRQPPKKHRPTNGKLSPFTGHHFGRGLPDEDLSAVKKLAGALRVFSNERGTMPMQYVQSFLLVADEEGLGVTDYAQRANISVSVMSRHLLDIGKRNREMEAGFGWVDYRNNPMELRKKEYFLTDRGRALIHQFKQQLSK